MHWYIEVVTQVQPWVKNMDSPFLENVSSIKKNKWTKHKSKTKPILFHN